MSATSVIMRALKAEGFTTRQIATELDREGFTTRRGTAWRFQYVAQALRLVQEARSRLPAAA